jgi:hypothetical protein
LEAAAGEEAGAVVTAAAVPETAVAVSALTLMLLLLSRSDGSTSIAFDPVPSLAVVSELGVKESSTDPLESLKFVGHKTCTRTRSNGDSKNHTSKAKTSIIAYIHKHTYVP